MENQPIFIEDFPAVSNTALMTLYCRAMDYRRKSSILHDQFSDNLYSRIKFNWKKVKAKLHLHDYILTAVRGRKFDRMCLSFLEKHRDGIIVSLGAGLDYRFVRIDNSACRFVEIDLPEVISFKTQLIPANSRNILIGSSILDYSWITQVQDLHTSLQAPVFFIAEGLIPYFDKKEIRELFQNIGRAFPQSEIFYDVCGDRTYKMMSKHSGIQDWGLRLKSGFKSGHDFEEWDINFHVIEEWYYPDDPDAKRGFMKLMWIIPAFKYWLYSIHGKWG